MNANTVSESLPLPACPVTPPIKESGGYKLLLKLGKTGGGFGGITSSGFD